MIKLRRSHSRRAGRRGFSHISTTLEAAAILGWFAVAVASEHRLDKSISARRASEGSAQDSSHASASTCESRPHEEATGDARPHASIKIDQGKLGVSDSSLPQTQPLGIAKSQAFPSQDAPMKHASVTTRSSADDAHENGQAGQFGAKRSLACQESDPKTGPKPNVPPLRSSLWEKNLKGY